jgi:hypothetical protein
MGSNETLIEVEDLTKVFCTDEVGPLAFGQGRSKIGVGFVRTAKRAILGKIFLMVLIALTFSPLCRAQASIAGDWQGTLSVENEQYKAVLHITVAADGSLKATADNPTQNAYGIPVEVIEIQGSKLSFAIRTLNGTYQGIVNKDATEIDGTWTQNQAYQLNFKRVVATPSSPTSQKPAPPSA